MVAVIMLVDFTAVCRILANPIYTQPVNGTTWQSHGMEQISQPTLMDIQLGLPITPQQHLLP